MMPTPKLEQDFLGTIVKRRLIPGLRLTETTLARQSRTPKHCHDRDLIGWSLEGSYTNVYTQGSEVIHNSRVMFCPAGEPHTTSSQTGALSFALELEPGWVKRLGELLLPQTPIVLDLGSMNSLMMTLHREFQADDNASTIAIEGIVLEMIAVFIRSRIDSMTKKPRWLAEVREIIHEKFREQITINSIAKQIKIHPVHLASAFRQSYGNGVLNYVRELRVSYASRQLSDSNDSLATIAQAAGFSDQSHFSRVFKRLTGMTPAAYRACIRPKPSENL